MHQVNRARFQFSNRGALLGIAIHYREVLEIDVLMRDATGMSSP